MKKSSLSPLLLLLFLALHVSAATFVVDKDALCFGNWCSNTCESAFFSTSNKQNIQDAIDDANAGDTISICDGTYTEELEIKNTNNLTLIKSSSAASSVIVQNNKTILKIDAIDGLTIDTIEFDSSDKIAIEIKNWSDNILFKNLVVNSDNEDAIKIKNAMGKIDIQNTLITANKKGIKADKELNGFSLVDSNITTSDVGIEFKKKLNGFVTISNILINANGGDGIKFEDDINNGILIENSEINASKKGIKFKKNVYGNLDIDNIIVNSTDEGISFEGGQSNPIIVNSKISSKQSDAIFTQSADWTNFKLENSCVKTERNDKFGFNLEIEKLNTNSDINNNCFYAPTANSLAYADDTSSGSKFNGNYWDGVTGDYTLNNISDTSTLGSCQLSCGGSCSTEYSGELNSIQMVGDGVSMKNTLQNNEFTEKTYKDNFVFSQPPVIFILPDTTGNNPASMRVKNVDTRGFDAAITEPQGEDGGHLNMNIDYFAINQGVFKLGDQFLEVGTVDTMATQKGYDSDSNSWVTITPKVKFCNPVVLVQIQGMKNEPGYIPNKISQPFLSAVVDSNTNDGTIKIALEMGETDLGAITENETIAYMIAEANIQASFVDDYNSTIQFETIKTDPVFYGWDDTNDRATANFVNIYTNKPLVTASLNSRFSLDGGWFRKQNHNNTSITLVVDEDRLNRNPKGQYQDTERSKKQNQSDNTHTPEIGGIFVFEGQFIKNGEVDVVSSFNAIDEGQGSIISSLNDGNITTKIVGEPFKLDIIARGEDNITKLDANITKLEIVKCIDEACVDCKITTEVEDFNIPSLSISQSAGYITTPNLTINNAYKLAKIRITGRSQDNSEVTVCSSDLFALRPDKYNLGLPAKAYAGDNIPIDVYANNLSGTGANKYNEEKGISFQIDANITKVGCSNGVLNVQDFSFENGYKLVDANYSDIGDVNITIREILGSEFAFVDNSDTKDEDRLIEPFSQVLTIEPYELNVTDVEYSEGWLYMADVDDINQSVKFSVLANDKLHNLVQNFTEDCYAQDVDVKTHFSVENTNSNVEIKYDDATIENIDDINRTITIPEASFINSKADIQYSFNIQRDYKTPYVPIKIGLREVTIESSNIAKDENNATVSLDKDFYYGRVKIEDISTNEQSTPHSLHVEVFKLGKYKQNSLHWYVNEDDDDSNVTLEDKEGFLSSSANASLDYISQKQATDGNINFILKHNEDDRFKSYIHITIPEYLWYNKYNSYNSAVDCGSHPCFEYNYLGDRSKKSINSGDFTGTSIGEDYNATKTKKGVKVFR